MIGWIAYRTARKALKASKRDQAPAKSWGEINSTKTGQWAIVIFATLFVGAVVLIGWFVTSVNQAWGH